MPYIFLEESPEPGAKSVEVSGDSYGHFIRVLRYKEGDRVSAFDRSGRIYDGAIKEVSGKSFVFSVSGIRQKVEDSGPLITLIVPVMPKDVFSLILSQAVEQGVRNILPVITERSIAGEGIVRKFDTGKWEKTVIAACMQSENTVIPAVERPVSFREAVKNAASNIKIIAHPYADRDCRAFTRELKLQSGCRSFTAAIGPEGGFTEEEIKLSTESGFVPLRLFGHKLRTPTAACAIVSLLNNI